MTKKFYTTVGLKRSNITSVLFLFFALLCITTGWGQVTEDFTNSNLTGTYTSNTFVGNGGVTWTYTDSRNEAAYPIDGKGIQLRRASTSTIQATISGGVGNFSFQYRKAATSSNARQLELTINDAIVGFTPVFGDVSGEDNTVYTLSVPNINVQGTFTVKIKNVGNTSTDRHTVIDNISWTGYESISPPEIIVENDLFYGQVGTVFNEVIVTDDIPTYFTLTGSLPTGLSFNTSTGVISGTPTQVGYFEIEITATNDYGTSSPAQFAIDIAHGDQVIDGFVNQTFYNTSPPFTLPAVTNIGLPVTYTSSDPLVATISGNVVTIHASGTTTITAHQAGNNNWNPYNFHVILTVIDAPISSAVISQIYGGGGNSGALYKYDFVELYNPTNSSVNIGGMYIQYTGPTQNFSQGSHIILPNFEMLPKSYFLIQLAAGPGGVSLPVMPDLVGNINMGAASGKVALTSDLITENGSPTNPVTNPQYIIDLVGYGNNVSLYEGDSTAPAGNNSNAIIRKDSGNQDTNNNGDDFITGVPTPRNSEYGIAIWDNGAWTTIPEIDLNVIIRDILTIDDNLNESSFEAKAMFLEPTGSLTIKENSFVIIKENIINNGSVTVESGGNLIQIDNATNTGSINVQRISNPMDTYNFTYWGAPVNTSLGNIAWHSESTPGNYTTSEPLSTSFAWSASTNGWDFSSIPYLGSMTAGYGYIIKAPNSFLASPAPKKQVRATFSGIPNNGNITVGIVGGGNHNLLGNPYPSAINIDDFLLEYSDLGNGVTEGTVYLWTNGDPEFTLDEEEEEETGGFEYQDDFAMYTLLGATSPIENYPILGELKIASGQAFFVKGASGGTVTFKNSYRYTGTSSVPGGGYNNTQFFKVMNTENEGIQFEKHRFWLNLKGENTGFKQTLIGYSNFATDGVDALDGVQYDGGNTTNLYTKIDSEILYGIQALALPFEETDIIPLGFTVENAGTFTLTLHAFDGLFEGQDIYIKDNVSDTTYNLKDGAYEFVTEAGTFEGRFEVVFQASGELGVDNPTLDNDWIAYTKDGQINLESLGFDMKDIYIYDMLGREVYAKQDINANQHKINKINGNQILIIKVISTDNVSSVRKIQN